MQIDLHSLGIFFAVAEWRSFSRAAEGPPGSSRTQARTIVGGCERHHRGLLAAALRSRVSLPYPHRDQSPDSSEGNRVYRGIPITSAAVTVGRIDEGGQIARSVDAGPPTRDQLLLGLAARRAGWRLHHLRDLPRAPQCSYDAVQRRRWRRRRRLERTPLTSDGSADQAPLACECGAAIPFPPVQAESERVTVLKGTLSAERRPCAGIGHPQCVPLHRVSAASPAHLHHRCA
jgi:hypothetical protein